MFIWVATLENSLYLQSHKIMDGVEEHCFVMNDGVSENSKSEFFSCSLSLSLSLFFFFFLTRLRERFVFAYIAFEKNISYMQSRLLYLLRALRFAEDLERNGKVR